MSTSPDQPQRLSRTTSPYLLQHARNPVEWYEWGPEALERARQEGKPVFLSIGYAACHWCHVMAHESFESPEIAAAMNELFVNIKVDREERPDLDEIYMQATLALNDGQGGWPMSVWLTPDLKPFFAGTYFPPTSRYGRPGFMELCQKIGEAWKEHRAEIVAHADTLTDVVRRSLRAAPAATEPLTRETVNQTAETLAQAFDRQSGGLSGGGTNKFPPSMALDVMLRSAQWRAPDDPLRRDLLDLVQLTLDRMAEGGVYDQLGGGIHRYSTDVEWHVPHFEKMLYDQALVSRIYLDAHQQTRNPAYARIVREMLDYVLSDLQAPSGGFCSSRDADSEGIEGKYYVWTRDEVLAVLGPECGAKFCACYDISESGNWRDPHDPNTPKSIPRLLRDTSCCAKLYGISKDEFSCRVANAKEKLLAARAKRVPPALDDKILCEWNGLMISSMARAGSVLDEPKYVEAAAKAADFLLDKLCYDGRLHRSYRAGKTLPTAFVSDYAGLIEGLIELYEATFDPRWVQRAAELNRVVIKHYWDARDGGFFFTPDDHEALIARSKDLRDNAYPSGNAMQLMNLLRLAIMLGEDELRGYADRMMATFSGDVRSSPWSSERFLAGVDFALGEPIEIAIVGDPADAATQVLLREVRQAYLPNHVVMLRNPRIPDDKLKAPLLAGRELVGGKPAAYVCRHFACRRPVTTPAELRGQLAERMGPR